MPNKSGFSSIVLVLIVLFTTILITSAYFKFSKNYTMEVENAGQESTKYIDYSKNITPFTYDKYIKVENLEINYEMPENLILVENPATFFENDKNTVLKNNYIFSMIDTCKFSFYYDPNNPVYFIAIESGKSTVNNWICDTYSYLRFNSVSHKDTMLDEELIYFSNNYGNGISKYLRRDPLEVKFEYFTFYPDLTDQNQHKFVVVYYPSYEEYVRPVFLKAIKSFDYNKMYTVPTDIKWRKVTSSKLPISFEYPAFWGEYSETLSDKIYHGTFSLYDTIITFKRNSVITGQSNTHKAARGIMSTDFSGYKDKEEGIYVKLGTRLSNCKVENGNRGIDPIGNAYVEFNLPNNEYVNGLRWQIPIQSPYVQDDIFMNVTDRCYLSSPNKLEDIKPELIKQLDEILKFADDETQGNIWIFKRILDLVEVN